MNAKVSPTVYDEKTPQSHPFPLEAYLYFPSDLEVKNNEGKKGVRRIFEGQVTYDTFELEMIQALKHLIMKQTDNKIELKNWGDSGVLRFLQANHYKLENTIKSMKQNEIWRNKFLPAKLSEGVVSFLHSGIAYIHGRDNKFRPIIILNAYKINMHEINIEYLLEGLSYLLEYTLLYLMLPGQIENWNIIVDLNFMGLFGLPLTNFKRVLEFVQSNYRSRLFNMLILNSPNSIYIPWKITRQFLDEITIQKIKIFKYSSPPELFSHINKEQIEKKFGGNSENLKEFWPPFFPSNRYYLNEKDFKNSLISEEAYYLMYKKEMLNKNCVNKDLIEEFSKKEEHIKKEELEKKVELLKKEEQIQTPIKRKKETENLKINLLKEEQADQKKERVSSSINSLGNALFEYDEKDDDEFDNKFSKIHESFSSPGRKKSKSKSKKLSNSNFVEKN